MNSRPHRNLKYLFNYVAFIWLAGGIIIGVYVGLSIVNPALFSNCVLWKYFNECFCIYGVFMVVCNWSLVRFSKISPIRQDLSLNVIDCIWCDICDLWKPPRTHHCPICNICVLKRDHHCFFAGRCVGLGNQRFFVIFTFWLSIGFIYSTICLIFYILICPEAPNIIWYDCVVLPLGILHFLLGYCSVFSFILVLLVHSAFFASFISLSLFITQLYLVVNGLTSYEFKKKIVSANVDQDYRQLFAQLMGQDHLFNFLFPIAIVRNIVNTFNCKEE